MTKPKILITGAAGRIGQALTQYLTGHYDIVLTDIRQPRQFYGHPFIKGDISDLDAMRSICQDIDIIVHLAGNADSEAGFESLLPSNIIGTYNLFQAAYEAGSWRIIYASSVNTVLGYPPEVQVQTDMPVRPANLYGATKVWGEALARYYADQKGLSCICLRFGATRHHEDRYFHLDNPMLDRMITYRDLLKLIKASIDAPSDLDFGVFFGTSDNPWNRFDITDSRMVLGYAPADDVFKIAELHTRKPWIHFWRRNLKRFKKILTRLGIQQQIESM